MTDYSELFQDLLLGGTHALSKEIRMSHHLFLPCFPRGQTCTTIRQLSQTPATSSPFSLQAFQPLIHLGALRAVWLWPRFILFLYGFASEQGKGGWLLCLYLPIMLLFFSYLCLCAFFFNRFVIFRSLRCTWGRDYLTPWPISRSSLVTSSMSSETLLT